VNFSSRTTVVGLVLVSRFLTYSIDAQAENGTQSANEKSLDSIFSDEVVVSATRVEQSILDAPANIAVLDFLQLSRTQSEHVQQNLSQVPGVSLQRGDGQESLPGIRSAVLTGAGACGNVLVMEEGVPVRGPAFCNVNELFDTHFEQAGQIEVVRGPGSAFYGSNSLTGSINVLLPHDGPSALSVELGENDYRRLKLSGGYSQPQARGTFYLTSTDTGSFREESGYEQHKFSWRERRQLGDWQLASGLTVTYLDQETAGFINGVDSYLDLDLARLNANPEAFRETESFRAWTTLSKEISDGREIRITPYVRQTEMDFLLHFLPGAPLEENEQSGFGWQASYRGQASSNLAWALGLDADFSSGDLRQSQEAPTQGSNFLVETVPEGLHYDYQVDAQQIAVFGHLDWNVNDSISLHAGIRGEVLEYDYDNRALDGRTRDD